MKIWAKTIGFGAVQITAAVLIHLWCLVVHWRFQMEHPEGYGAGFSNIFWNFSWSGIAVAAALSLGLIVLHLRNLDALYHAAYMFGVWFLVFWFGAALISMELAFVGWSDPRGMHY